MNPIGNTPASTLQDETQAARTLLELLKQEQAQLIAADINALTALTDEKTRAIARISELASRRYATLAAAGFEAQETGMQAWLEKSAQSKFRQVWDELLSLAQSAKEMNRINGLLINKHLANNQQALNILRGGQTGQSFYGPNGQSATNTRARGLAIG